MKVDEEKWLEINQEFCKPNEREYSIHYPRNKFRTTLKVLKAFSLLPIVNEK